MVWANPLEQMERHPIIRIIMAFMVNPPAHGKDIEWFG